MLRLVLIQLFLATTGLAQSPRHEHLRQLDRQRFEAQVKKDTATLGQLLANDMVYTHSTGVVENKSTFLRNLAGGRWNYQQIDTDSVIVHLHGRVAILTGRATMQLRQNDKTITVRMAYTDVWRRVGRQRWQFIAWAACRLAN